MAAKPRRTSAVPPGPPSDRRRFLSTLFAGLAGGAFLARGRTAQAATQGAEPFIGELMLFAGNFAPRGWAFCDGQLLPISQNTALFSILGTTYGGNGQTTFALPDLRGRAPIHPGQGPGLSYRNLGESSGEENHSLVVPEMPAHNHAARADSGNGSSDTPTGRYPARNPAGVPHYSSNAPVNLAPDAVTVTGGSQPHNNMPPYLGISYCICLEGIFPSRN